jgi:LacI family transcriptional regulator
MARRKNEMQNAVSTTRKSPLKSSAPVGLRDIAKDLNISVSLVSKVLSGRMGNSGAAAGMVRAIQDKAQELQYQKNRQAEALSTGRQNAIAVCIHRHGEPGSAIVEEMVEGIAQEAAIHNQRLVIQYYDTLEQFRAFAPELHRNVVDGVIMGGIGHPQLFDELRAMERRGLPAVTLLDKQFDPDIANVGISQVEVSRLATVQLIEQGCRRIAHFGEWTDAPAGTKKSPVPATYYPGLDRSYGYRQALREASLKSLPELVIRVPTFGYSAGWEAAEGLLDRGIPFDGIVGQSDHHVAGALNLLVSRGWKVPQQVKLIGVDNSPFCQYMSVALSSVSQEFQPRGRIAVRLLMEKLNGQKTSSVNLEPIVHARLSSTRL